METNQLSINYIKHHVEAKKALQLTNKCRPNHISVYEALFSLWNHYRFPTEFSINRAEMMKLSCIGSKNTYTKVMKQLHDWKIVHYLPSYDPLFASKIRMIRFDNRAVKSGKGDEKSQGNGDDKGMENGTGKVEGPLYKQEEKEENKNQIEKTEKGFFDLEKELKELFDTHS